MMCRLDVKTQTANNIKLYFAAGAYKAQFTFIFIQLCTEHPSGCSALLSITKHHTFSVRAVQD